MRKIKFSGWMFYINVILGLFIWLNLMTPVVTGRNGENEVRFLQETIDGALAHARQEKKLLVCYLYYWNDRIPALLSYVVNQNTSNRIYALKHAVFSKVLIRRDRTGAVIDKKIADFLTACKLPHHLTEPYLVILDQFGNLLEKLTLPLNKRSFISSLKKAIRKAQKIERDLKNRYRKVTQLRKKGEEAAAIKELKAIINTNWQGYEYFEKARQDLDELNESVKHRLKEIIKDYLAEAKEDRDQEAILFFLKDMAKTYKDLEISKKIKATINLIEEDKDDELEKMTLNVEDKKDQ